jgi:hypothetical protein
MRPRHACAGGGDRRRADTFDDARRPGIPRVRQHEQAALMERLEVPGLIV